ncbi:hypothetical protein FLAVO9AF_170116 [Flavobacterium sp. 9AF]|nr:hypothetical protein FLAVO9AF_170116 [Flavobacterium sp. 9AF]
MTLEKHASFSDFLQPRIIDKKKSIKHSFIETVFFYPATQSQENLR